MKLHRPWVTTPDDPLLLPGRSDTPLYQILDTAMDTAKATFGLPDSDLDQFTFLAVPLPIYSPDGDYGLSAAALPRRRWAGTRPEGMWNPLMWLPERVAQPYIITFPDGTEREESAHEWALRVALELCEAGLYDVATAQWVDVLAAHDLDVNDPVVVARVADWLDGRPDRDLDRIDLTANFDHSRPADGRDWALPIAQSAMDGISAAAILIAAEGLLTSADEVVRWASDPDGAGDPGRTEQAVAMTHTLCDYAVKELGSWRVLGTTAPFDTLARAIRDSHDADVPDDLRSLLAAVTADPYLIEASGFTDGGFGDGPIEGAPGLAGA